MWNVAELTGNTRFYDGIARQSARKEDSGRQLITDCMTKGYQIQEVLG